MPGKRTIDWNAVVDWSSPATTTIRPGDLQNAGHHHPRPPPPGDSTTKKYFEHTSAPRVNTDAFIARSLKENYPNLELVVTPASNCELLAYAQAGFASYQPVKDVDGKLPSSLQWELYLPPGRRIDGAMGELGELTSFGKYLYQWKGEEFIVYLVDGRDGTQGYPSVRNYYLLTPSRARAQQLLLEAGRWNADLHDEIWVYDGGFWQKNRELYASIRKASWDSVILDADMKKALIDDHISFFASRETYAHLRVPWKRGIIYHGPPGNGKTISIKATMHMLYDLDVPVPTLYVRSLASYAGPEYSVKEIFGKAREFAPCYLVFEDLDSLITDSVRSYFLNEVDGLKNNDGIFMVGSTNHLDRLDPGIAKRPSRFDRKYYFPDPDLAQRVAYCQFWQAKLKDNKEIEFPDELCKAIAEITDKFSFAYIQEAFVAALLAIAQRAKRPSSSSSSSWVIAGEREKLTQDLDDGWVGVMGGGGGGGEELEDLVLWVEIKKQIKILREGIEDKRRQLP